MTLTRLLVIYRRLNSLFPSHWSSRKHQVSIVENLQAKTELTTALAEIESLKKDFKADQAGWETEKSALLKRAEDAEAALKPVAEELAVLKHQVNAMTAAIFGM